MEAIASLLQDDPWLTMLPEGRLIAFRKRRERLFGMPRDVAPEAVPAQTDPPRQLPPMKEPWFEITEIGHGPVMLADIVKACARRYRVMISDILSARRNARIVKARQIAFFLAKRLTQRSLPDIGRRIGGRDHTTVLYAVAKIERLRQSDTCLEMDLRVIAYSVGGSLDQ